MYFENNRRSANRRADAEFLRRMLGGELTGDTAANDSRVNNISLARNTVPTPSNACKMGCDGTQNDKFCPQTIPAPALAMVYSPKQCWRNLFEPAVGIAHGTIFAELVLPLESDSKNHCKEVNPHCQCR